MKPVPTIPRATRVRADHSAAPLARSRFLHSDRYRVEREWKRYEGTPQRELFRSLRERFLVRNVGRSKWAVDIGSGPGRFTRWLGREGTRAIALDFSLGSLAYLTEKWPRGADAPPPPDRVRADGARPPFLPESFGTVAVLGNSLGFAGASSDSVLASAGALVAPGGRLLLEVAPGPGERSNYLARLPAKAVSRLLRAPVRAVLPRVLREGFRAEAVRKAVPGPFRRIAADQLGDRLGSQGWRVLETVAVAPTLGPDAERIASTRADPRAWDHLLELEEEVGRDPRRWTLAASVLLAVERRLSDHTIN